LLATLDRVKLCCTHMSACPAGIMPSTVLPITSATRPRPRRPLFMCEPGQNWVNPNCWTSIKTAWKFEIENQHRNHELTSFKSTKGIKTHRAYGKLAPVPSQPASLLPWWDPSECQSCEVAPGVDCTTLARIRNRFCQHSPLEAPSTPSLAFTTSIQGPPHARDLRTLPCSQLPVSGISKSAHATV